MKRKILVKIATIFILLTIMITNVSASENLKEDFCDICNCLKNECICEDETPANPLSDPFPKDEQT